MTACHTWEAAPSAIEQNSLAKGSVVRVQMKNGARYELASARLKPDSLVGRSGRDRFAIALTDIRSLETSQLSKGRTAGMAAAAALAVPAFFLLVILTGGATISPGF
jgi:hypothetical protein